MRFDTLDAWLAWQEQLNPATIDLGLARMQCVLQRMNLVKPDFTVITVAGTNGKGSSVAMLQSIYLAAGYRVGSYTSPHLQRYNERVVLDGVMADDATLCHAFEQIEQARTADGDEVPLTYFEFGTLAAIVIFAQANVDIAILEVGLGGRLDAVNALTPDIALVTMVDIDHQSWLGSDRETIAREKAGIYRSGVPAICADANPANSLVAHAADIGARYYGLNTQFCYALNEGEDGATWHWRSAQQRYDALPLPSLTGAFQLQNAAGVLMAITLLQPLFPVPIFALETGLRQVQVAGRMQRIVLDEFASVEWLLDVAHNRASAQVLSETLAAQPCDGNTYGVIAMLADKDIAAVMAAMQPVIDDWYVASLGPSITQRGASAATIISSLATAATAPQSFADVPAAMTAVRQHAQAGDRIVVFGSFYTVAEAKTFLQDVGCCEAN